MKDGTDSEMFCEKKISAVRVEAFEACGESKILVLLSRHQNNTY